MVSADRERLPVFVYGTLRPGQRNHAAFLRGRTVGEEPARMRGAVLFEGPGYPYAVPDATGEIFGDLVHLAADQHDGVLAALDRLEGSLPGGPGRHYVRVERPVLTEGGEPARAWVYLAGDEVARRLRAVGTRIPGGRWPA
ncbi:gamma-glutamylcyclotransferase [Streptomyces sp. HU2014]|uniref:gamma-glutamylcyclotransferase family protein n=1 Tax=Streptomyces TaxID=1883 RepID=UPI000B45276E|nr:MULTISPECIES: gamma-glutamylcyclotransferase family protein [Streptomyces]UQI49350.1 gamma-glutamylcyclotransferase [Streptomyces sp. HU2014]